MRLSDSKREKAEQDRNHARVDLLVLASGFSKALDILGTEYRNTKDIKYLIHKMDIELTESVRMFEKAEEAYELYWRRRLRRRIVSRSGKNPRKAKKVVN